MRAKLDEGTTSERTTPRGGPVWMLWRCRHLLTGPAQADYADAAARSRGWRQGLRCRAHAQLVRGHFPGNGRRCALPDPGLEKALSTGRWRSLRRRCGTPREPPRTPGTHLCQQDSGKGQPLLLPQRQSAGPVGHSIQVAADALQQGRQLRRDGVAQGRAGVLALP